MKTFKFTGKRLITAGVLAAGLLGTGALTGTAHADTVTVSRGTQAYWITAGYDALNVSVAGGSTSVGTRIIQWPNDGGAEQKWFFDGVYDNGRLQGYMLRNDNSGLCIWTDDQAGDALLQGSCTPNTVQDIFEQRTPSAVDNYFTEDGYPDLALDVSGGNGNWGTNIDGWYSTSSYNQDFYVTPTSS